MVCAMVSELSSGLMVADMKVNGETIKRMDRENLCTQMAIYMKANGSTTRPKEWVLIPMLMEPTMRVSGLMTSNMVMASNLGQMVLDTRATMKMVKKRDKVALLSQMEAIMKAPLSIMRSVALVIITGRMVKAMLAIGERIRWMVKVS